MRSFRSNLLRGLSTVALFGPRASCHSSLTKFGVPIFFVPTDGILNNRPKVLEALDWVKKEAESKLSKNPQNDLRIVVAGHGNFGTMAIGDRFYPPELVEYILRNSTLKAAQTRFFFSACRIGYGVGSESKSNPVDLEVVGKYQKILNKNISIVLCGDEDVSTGYLNNFLIKNIFSHKGQNDFEQMLGCLEVPMPFKMLFAASREPKIFEHHLQKTKTLEDLSPEKCQEHIISQMQKFTQFYLDCNPQISSEERQKIAGISLHRQGLIKDNPEITNQYLKFSFLLNLTKENAEYILHYFESGNYLSFFGKDYLEDNQGDSFILEYRSFYVDKLSDIIAKKIAEGNLEFVKKLIDHGLQVEFHKYHTLLSTACSAGQVEIVEFLLNRGADPLAEVMDNYRKYPIIIDVLGKLILDYQDCTDEEKRANYLKIMNAVIASDKFTIEPEKFVQKFKVSTTIPYSTPNFQEILDYVVQRIEHLKQPATKVSKPEAIIDQPKTQTIN